MLKLKVRIYSLVEENKSLRDQLQDFQNMYDRVTTLYIIDLFILREVPSAPRADFICVISVLLCKMYDYKLELKFTIVDNLI